MMKFNLGDAVSSRKRARSLSVTRAAFLLAILFGLGASGCNSKRSESNAQHPRLSDAKAVLIESKSQLADHLGELVTLKGKLVDDDTNHLLGVLVSANESLAGKVVTATGMLSRSILDPALTQGSPIQSANGDDVGESVPDSSTLQKRYTYQLTPVDPKQHYPIEVVEWAEPAK